MTEKNLYPSDQADKVLVRMPDGMRDRLKDAAKANNRTMNAEIVARLEQSFKQEEEEFGLAFRSAVLEDEIKSLEAKLGKKLGASPTADEIADKVASRLMKMIPIPLKDFDRLIPDYAKPRKPK